MPVVSLPDIALRLLAACVLWTLSALGSWTWTRRGARLPAGVGVLLGLLALAAPWTCPAQWGLVRFAVAVVSVLLVLRQWELVVRRPPTLGQAPSWPEFSLALFSFGELDLRRERQPKRALSVAAWRSLRALLKGSLVFLLLVGGRGAGALYDDDGIVGTSWWLAFSYLAASTMADVATALSSALSGRPTAEVFRMPPLAASPVDFWGRRWNLTFRNLAHRLVFLPTRRVVGVRAAGLLVFVLSALVHEYTVWAALGGGLGWMSAFFLLQGAAVVLLSLRRGRPLWTHRGEGQRLVARGVAVVGHVLWMELTAPLFFYPLRRIVQVQHWLSLL